MIAPFGMAGLNILHLRQRPIVDDQQPNLSCYNEELRRLHRPTWHNVSWLFSECYLYRYLISRSALISQAPLFNVCKHCALETV